MFRKLLEFRPGAGGASETLLVAFSMFDQWIGNSAARYADVVAAAIRSRAKFAAFRSHRCYRAIVENVTPADGRRLYEAVANGPLAYLLADSEWADTIGGPRSIEVNGLRLSPTTLRYLATLNTMIGALPSLPDAKTVCEIGVGYGGLARLVISHSRAIETYRLVDLPDVLSLSRQYLEHFNLRAQIEYRSRSELGTSDRYDFAISNWAFSEFSRDLQAEYLAKILTRARAGYLIMNSGLDGATKGFGGHSCLSDAEILAALPNARIHGPARAKGYVIIFGE